MNKTDKIKLVEGLTNNLKEAKSVIVVNYSGMGVIAQQELKKRLLTVDATMLVVKNTLLTLSAKEAKLDDQLTANDILVGQNAVIVAKSDPIAPLSVLAKFAKEFEIPSLKVGIVDGQFQDTASLTKLALLPSKDILLAQVLSSLASPMYSLVGTLNSNLHPNI